MNSTQVSTYCGSDGFVEDIWKSTRRHPLSDVPGRPSVFLFNFFCFFCNSFCFLSWNDNKYITFEFYFGSALIIKVKECHHWILIPQSMIWSLILFYQMYGECQQGFVQVHPLLLHYDNNKTKSDSINKKCDTSTTKFKLSFLLYDRDFFFFFIAIHVYHW